MGIAGGPNLNQDGLVFLYDVFDQDNSYKGEPTTNLIDAVNFTTDYNTSWNAQENVTITRNQINPIGNIDNACLKIHPNSGSDNYMGVRGVKFASAGTNHTFSFWAKGNKAYTNFPINFGVYQVQAYVNITTEWKYFSVQTGAGITFTDHTVHFGGWGTWTDTAFDLYLWHPQLEQKSHATPFVNGTRSSTQGLLDVAGANQIDISNASFNANAQITFDGTNDYINVPYNTSHNLTNQGTISVWINPASLTQGSYAGLVSQSTGGSANSQAYQLSWRQVSGGLFGSICNGSGTYNDVLASFPSTANAWYNIVFTWNGSLLSIYNNGILSAQSAQTIVNQVLTTDLTIGGYTYKGAGGVDEYFNGSINNVELFNRGFTAQEVLQNYNTKKSRFGLK